MSLTIIPNTSSRKRAMKRRRGVAAIEFAVVLPILMLLLLGAADFGRCFYTSVAITNTARAGAEYGSMHPFDSSTQGTWQTGVRQAAVDELGASNSFDPGRLVVTATSITESGGARRVSVQAAYPFNTILHWPYIPASISVQGASVMRTIR